MEERYRTDYAGEFIVTNSRWVNGHKEQTREWIPNPIDNQHISGRAACIGSTFERDIFDYTRLQRHRGGLLGSKKLQTYGIGAVAQQMRLDFTVETNPDKLKDILSTDYQQTNTVYTNPRNCLAYPGEFYLIPLNPHLLDIGQILYLAAFDNHKEIFMLGYTKDTPVDSPNWTTQVRTVIDAYPGTLFYMIGETTNMPDIWLEAANGRNLTYREFISYCDV
jgi:hypothetical protein